MNSHMKLLSIFVVHLDAILPTFLEIFSFVHVHHGIDVNSGAEDVASQAFYRWLCSLSTFQMDSLFWSFVVANKLQIVFQKGFFFLTFFFFASESLLLIPICLSRSSEMSLFTKFVKVVLFTGAYHHYCWKNFHLNSSLVWLNDSTTKGLKLWDLSV